jgi:NitT/TauT family transport system substrate-binding protein
MDRMVEGMQVVGKLTGGIDWSKIIDTSFLPKELQPKS